MTRSNTRMTAIVCHGPEDYRVEEVARPTAGPRELVIRIGACGICASDCKCWSGAKMFWGGEGKPSWVKAPVIPGHEFFGYVDEIGDGAAEHFGVASGDRVIAEQIVPCWKCRYCTFRPVLDVRGARHLRLPAAGGRWRHGRVHEAAGERHRPHHPARDVAGGCGDHRAAGLRHPYRAARRHPARRRGGDRRRRAARPDDDAGGAAQDAEDSGGDRPGAGAPGARPQLRRRRDDRPAPRRCAGDRAVADRRLWLRRVYRDHRRAGRRHAGAGADPQARPLRRVLGVRQGDLGRLVDHRRPQGTGRARRASGAVLLPDRHRPDVARAGDLAGASSRTTTRSRNGTPRSRSPTRPNSIKVLLKPAAT